MSTEGIHRQKKGKKKIMIKTQIEFDEDLKVEDLEELKILARSKIMFSSKNKAKPNLN